MFDVADFSRKRRSRFGEPLYYFEELESTNSTAEILARDGCPEGTLVLANGQTGGKGRKGNGWYSPPDVNLYFSLVLRPQNDRLRYLPFCAVLSAQRALRRVDLETDLKWPNDLLMNGRKICGILIRTAMEEDRLQHAVVGCGMNVNATLFPASLQDIATSVALEKGETVSRESLLGSILLEFQELYEKIDAAPWEEFCQELERHSSYLRDCQVTVRMDDCVLEGTTQGLDSFGGLVLRTDAGQKVVYAGEVSACRKK